MSSNVIVSHYEQLMVKALKVIEAVSSYMTVCSVTVTDSGRISIEDCKKGMILRIEFAEGDRVYVYTDKLNWVSEVQIAELAQIIDCVRATKKALSQ